MMSFEEFAEYLKNSVLQYLPKEFQSTEVRVTEANKNNNLHLTGITIVDPDSNISPTIYINDIYSEYEDGNIELDECARCVAEKCVNNLVSGEKNIKLSYLLEYENVKDKIVPRLVSAENNESYLENIPHRVMDGLAVVYYLPVTEFDEKVGKASICIHNGLLEKWGIVENVLYEAAIENLKVNMEVKFQSMREVLLETLFDDEKEIDAQMGADNIFAEDIGMYVLTNDERFYGAAMLLNHKVMDEIEERIGEFFILPSSVHETILVKKDFSPSLEYLEEMVREVNRTEVSADERLSNRVFLYDAKTKEVYRADHEEEHRRHVAEAARDSEEQVAVRTIAPMRRGR